MGAAYIFDWSGTLSDNFHCFCRVCELMFAELGAEMISEDEIRMTFTTPYMKFWNLYFPKLSKKRQCELYEKFIHQAGNPELYRGVRLAISSLHKSGHKLYIVSSDPLSKLHPEIEKSGLSGMLDGIVGNVHHKKQALKLLVKKHKLNPAKTFYIGDTSGDIEAGKFAGVKTIGISWGFQHPLILAQSEPDFLISTIAGIKKIAKQQ